MVLARQFAIRARDRLPKDSADWRRATDIVLVSQPTGDDLRRGGGQGLTITSQGPGQLH
jgi:hypothetical protein